MDDERDRLTREAERREHVKWMAQHAAWAREAERWLEALETERGRLDELLTRETKRVREHVERIRRHGAAVERHEMALSEMELGGCAGCSPVESFPHGRSARTHRVESHTHEELAKRQRGIHDLLSALDALLGREPREG